MPSLLILAGYLPGIGVDVIDADAVRLGVLLCCLGFGFYARATTAEGIHSFFLPHQLSPGARQGSHPIGVV